jgi:hypothetical protein
MRVFKAIVEREGKWWMVSVPEIDGLTQARSLVEAKKMARSLVSITEDIAQSDFEVNLTVSGVGGLSDISAEVSAIAELRNEARTRERAATTRASSLAKALAKEGLTVRDIGSVLGVTFQRAHQLVSASVSS